MRVRRAEDLPINYGRISTLTLASLSTGHATLSAEEQRRLRDARLSDLDELGPPQWHASAHRGC